MLVKNFYTVIKLGFMWGNAELMKNIGEKMVNTTGGQVVPDGYYYPTYDGYLSFSPKGVKTNNSSFVYYGFLIDRTILATPLSLKTGQSGSIKYRITNASIFNV